MRFEIPPDKLNKLIFLRSDSSYPWDFEETARVDGVEVSKSKVLGGAHAEALIAIFKDELRSLQPRDFGIKYETEVGRFMACWGDCWSNYNSTWMRIRHASQGGADGGVDVIRPMYSAGTSVCPVCGDLLSPMNARNDNRTIPVGFREVRGLAFKGEDGSESPIPDERHTEPALSKSCRGTYDLPDTGGIERLLGIRTTTKTKSKKLTVLKIERRQ